MLHQTTIKMSLPPWYTLQFLVPCAPRLILLLRLGDRKKLRIIIIFKIECVLSNTLSPRHCIFWSSYAEAPASLMPPVKTGSCLSMDGRRHENEESWHDGCRECYCHNGREMCALITCPVPNCGNPTIHPGQCCPSCPGKMLHSMFYHKSTFLSLVCTSFSHVRNRTLVEAQVQVNGTRFCYQVYHKLGWVT